MAESNSGVPDLGPSRLGRLLKLNTSGAVRDVANVGDANYAWTADHVALAPNDFPDSNPYRALVEPGRTYVVDAGSNTLNVVTPDGSNRILAYFPDSAIRDSTPTSVTKGPDGALYVGTLALVDRIERGPSAIVHRVDPKATDPNDLATVLSFAKPCATGLRPINGCTFGPGGTFDASQLITSPGFSGGDVVKSRLPTRRRIPCWPTTRSCSRRASPRSGMASLARRGLVSASVAALRGSGSHCGA